MQLITMKIEKPDDTNFILGQTHFIKSVEDIHEALVTFPVSNLGWRFVKPLANAWSAGPGLIPP
jgi:uncharacterized protein